MTTLQIFRENVTDLFEWTAIPGTNTINRTFFVKIFFQNAVGVNLGSTARQITISSTQGVRITIPNGFVKSGEFPERYIIAYSQSGNPGSYAQLASISALESDGSRRPLPLSVDITTDAALMPLSVPSESQLPNNVPAGKTAIVSATGATYVKTATDWEEFWKNTTLIEPSSITDQGGFLQNYLAVSQYAEKSTYAANGNFSRRYYISYFNSGNLLIPANSLIGLVVLINGVPSGSLVDRLEISLMGYVSIDTGIIDTTPSIGYPTIFWKNERDSNFILPNDLPSNSAALFSVRFKYNAAELSTIQPDSSIGLDLFLYNEGSVPAPYTAFTGNFIGLEGERCAVVPNAGLSLTIKSGVVAVNKRQSVLKGSQTIGGLLPNTIFQKLICDSELNARIEQSDYPLRDSEALLAYIDTTPYEYYNQINVLSLSVSNNNRIKVTVTHPITSGVNALIRYDYPDKYVASQEGYFNPKNIIIFLTNTDTDTSYKYAFAVTFNDTQECIITELLNESSILFNSIDSRVLYVNGFTGVSEPGGSIPGGNYEIRVGYEWDENSITAIKAFDHPSTLKRVEDNYLFVEENTTRRINIEEIPDTEGFSEKCIFVNNSTGSDQDGDGTVFNKFQTINRAIRYLANDIDCKNQIIQIRVDKTDLDYYESIVSLNCNASKIIITTNGVVPLTIDSPPGSNAIYHDKCNTHYEYVSLILKNTYNNNPNYPAVRCLDSSYLVLSDVTFDLRNDAYGVVCNNSTIALDNTTIENNSNMRNLLLCTNNSYASIFRALNFGNNVNINTLLHCMLNSMIIVSDINVNGTFTGNKLNVSRLSGIYTESGNANIIPGTNSTVNAATFGVVASWVN